MTARCPDGHLSAGADYCDTCGKPLGAAGPAVAGPVAASAASPSAQPVAARPARRCPKLGSVTEAGSTCDQCLFALDGPDSVAVWEEEHWEVVVRPDRRYFDMVDSEGLAFPDTPYTRRIPLVGDHVRIGRRSKGVRPEIDLSGPLEDPCVSRQHALLMRQPDGSWAIVDQDSSNGTYLKAEGEPVPANERVPLRPGDEVHVGAWTTLTVERVEVAVAPSREVSVPSKDTRPAGRARQPMEISLLGPLQVTVGGQAAMVSTPKLRAVLAVLALRMGSFVSTGDLEWAVWGDGEPASALKALHGYISDLRLALGREAIETEGAAYRLVGHKEVVVDVYRFDRRIARGRSLLASGHPGAAVAELTRALDLWRGEPLIDLVDSPAGAGEVARLLECRASAQEDLFEGQLQLGNHHAIVSTLEAAVSQEPLRERRWRQLMVAQYRDGRQRDALQTFRRYRTLLGEEYGLEPSSEIVTLEGDIAIDQPELRWTPPAEAGVRPR